MSSLITVRQFDYSVGGKKTPYSDEFSVCNKEISLNGDMSINYSTT